MNVISKIVTAMAVTAMAIGTMPTASAVEHPSVSRDDKKGDLRGPDRKAKAYKGRDVLRATYTVSSATVKTVVKFRKLPVVAKKDRNSEYVVYIDDRDQESVIYVSPRHRRPRVVSLAYVGGDTIVGSGEERSCGSYRFSVKHSTLTIKVPRSCLLDPGYVERPLATPRFTLSTGHYTRNFESLRARDGVNSTRSLDLR